MILRLSLEISGEVHYLWRAVDQYANVLDILVQRRRYKNAAKKFFRKLLKGLQYVSRVIITDKLGSYSAANTDSIQRSATMKKFMLVISIVIWIATVLVMGQDAKQKNDREGEIRKIDLAEADAILRNDAAAAGAFYADDIVVNNPRYTVTIGKQALMALIKSGNIHYSSFVREIETITFQGETAIVMGKETVKPDGNAPGAGQTILRRYTNIWMKRNSKWLLIARHANIICTN